MSVIERKSRWGAKDERQEFPGMSPELPPGLTESQLKSYVIYIRLEEINRKLRSGQVYPYRERSLSPGKNAPDREQYYRKKLEDERSRLIESALQNNPEYSTDIDYNTWLDRHLFGPGAKDKKNTGNNNNAGHYNNGNNNNNHHHHHNQHHHNNNNNNNNNNNTAASYKCQEKVWIPQREYPDINFIGLLIGPRGNTLKKMESETGAKISIRGKGSLKEGKNDPASLAAADEELHALVMADSTEKIEKCVRIINKIIETAASTPEESNELKRIQLRELAALNGTLRDEDSVVCGNCGETGHRRFECTQRRNITNSLTCRICGGTGHIASDCMHRDNPEMIQQSRIRAEQMDSAYQDFLVDIGERASSNNNNNNQLHNETRASSFQHSWNNPASNDNTNNNNNNNNNNTNNNNNNNNNNTNNTTNNANATTNTTSGAAATANPWSK